MLFRSILDTETHGGGTVTPDPDPAPEPTPEELEQMKIDQYFTVELSSDMADVILGFNTVARITILDTETHGGGTVTPEPEPEP